MYCKYCGKQIYDVSKYCRYCGKLVTSESSASTPSPAPSAVSSSGSAPSFASSSSSQKTGSSKTMSSFIGVLALALVAVISVIFVFGPKIFEARSELVTLKEYNQIQVGQTYNEVVKIIGSEGILMSEVGYMGYTSHTFTWEGNGPSGSNASVMFINGEVYSKGQIGLK